MALLLEVSKNPAIAGDTITFTASGDDDVYLTYAFLRNNVPIQDSSSPTFTINSASTRDSGLYTVKGTSSTDTVTSNEINLDVSLNTMTGVTSVMSRDKQNYVYGDQITLTAVVSGQPAASTINYAWTIDDLPVAGTSNTYVTTASKVGTIRASCKATVKHENYYDFETTSNQSIVVPNRVMTGVVTTVSRDKSSYILGEEYTLTCSYTGAPAGSTVIYAWTVNGATVGGNSNTYTGTADKLGHTAAACSVTLSAPSYNTYIGVGSTDVMVDEKPVPVPEDGYAYYNPLPIRDTAFIQIGWWVIDEINIAEDLGLNWKEAPDPLRYKRDLLTLAKMFNDYPEVEVQESRNGYVWNKAQVEAGYIYY